ncbi:Hypothetical predicted protein [Paramuricea clavata]|uniref:Uncharacterized protein n=1 Tax=Paramuricea clavata TaxID=317549 RepID=A0A7D9IJ86_PARCT|nr:Hypothetical predicted protein [Paramuricea clavata]
MSFSDSSDDLELMELSDEPATTPIKAKSKRKRKIPSSLADIYDTNMEEDRDEKKAKKGWCIIEWDGEDTYDPVLCKDIFPADELPMTSIAFCPGEIVSALCQGKRYKGRIAAFADTKAGAEKTYLSIIRAKLRNQNVNMPKMSVNIKGAAEPAEVKLKNKVQHKVKDKVKLKGKSAVSKSAVSKSAVQPMPMVQHQQIQRDSTPNFLMASSLANKKEKCCEVLYY